MSVSASDDLRRVTLIGRRICIILIILLGYFYFRLTGGSDALAAIGLIAFLGVSQVMPALVGGLFWRFATPRWRIGRHNYRHADLGLYVAAAWDRRGAYRTLDHCSRNGLFGWQWLHPNALFGVSF